ncbi:hypothetical protein SNK03_010857 [Fusarium graminearum]|uniref:Chromosome 3, complete genome n=1 Tax=Gibberella zeae (strain ATCC MYA-4620 / CBS 123657 / FGSC 9075 / NRRL 31084 / PH-1) TaxID=229533 RepID=I1RLY3_GIBZE|nr:hypothetical protein FGSG_04954 [Fusarium graminearum PH-1]ESU10849.1 hypothetical protein FGSG_04954 [Fusarium graminearum PH-1]EYB29206.1 hypothetical protein FG05_04954 [Fusarium graminearum]CEF87297.1 unnamed protein product [Fusarium graminearum]CZS83472.1 unnamed protein product [Fusarium graminearum]|eukprot:XP_011323425.1 hypothetical protein FGSG_04954 [Fusarium graminearum PH-1]
MCQLSTTAMICEQCRRLITYASVKSFCSTEECMKKLQDSSQYVSCLTCNKCNPSGKGLGTRRDGLVNAPHPDHQILRANSASQWKPSQPPCNRSTVNLPF